METIFSIYQNEICSDAALVAIFGIPEIIKFWLPLWEILRRAAQSKRVKSVNLLALHILISEMYAVHRFINIDLV